MLTEGSPAPDFYLQASADPEAEYMLSAAAAQSPVVVAFLPDNEVRARALVEALADVDWAAVTDAVAVFGIVRSERLGRRLDIDKPFPVLLDQQGYVAGQYGLPTRPDGSPQQAILIVDESCKLAYAWTGSDEPPMEAVTETVTGL